MTNKFERKHGTAEIGIGRGSEIIVNKTNSLINIGPISIGPISIGSVSVALAIIFALADILIEICKRFCA